MPERPPAHRRDPRGPPPRGIRRKEGEPAEPEARGGALWSGGRHFRLEQGGGAVAPTVAQRLRGEPKARERDRKSTRLNSSHSQISYAVFCLKKKKNKTKLVTIQ